VHRQMWQSSRRRRGVRRLWPTRRRRCREIDQSSRWAEMTCGEDGWGDDDAAAGACHCDCGSTERLSVEMATLMMATIKMPHMMTAAS